MEDWFRDLDCSADGFLAAAEPLPLALVIWKRARNCPGKNRKICGRGAT